MKTFAFSRMLLVTLLFICTGCDVAQPAMSVDPVRYHSNENGLIVGSITFPEEKAHFNGYFIRVRSLDPDAKLAKKNSTEIHISPEQLWRMKHKGELDGGKTYLFVLERPAGKYEFSSIRLFSNSGIIALQRTDYSGSFSIPFDVGKRQATYAGNIIFNETASATDTVVSYTNNFARDISAIKRLKPTVDWDKASNDMTRRIEYNANKVKP